MRRAVSWAAELPCSVGTSSPGADGDAPPAWYRDADLDYPGPTQDLGEDLVGTLMAD